MSVNENPPAEWAIERVLQLHPTGWTPSLIINNCNRNGAYASCVLAFARYIEQHEEAPVDPVEEAYRAAVAVSTDCSPPSRVRVQPKHVDAFRAELEKRGIELGKAST